MSAPSAGNVIGPYVLVRQIGEGGMGVVYHAQQREPIRRDVALKVIKPGMDTRQVIARFESERQALAVMDHPNVARVLDAGATASGLPYFVMELVDGAAITTYCDARGLSVRERIAIFVTVCQAIQHAHQKGIIHRDIKPSNILVSEQEGKAVAKVIDFGLAKALGKQATDLTVTSIGTVMGTLNYMSPEQAQLSRQDVDTRSDVYSLGVVLYELLTGTTPIASDDLANIGYVQALLRICTEETAPPSARLRRSHSSEIAARRKSDVAHLSKLLHGDLDWITGKALEKDRTRRYETANAFARDLQRYLAEEPVEAAPPSMSYRMMKFARKHAGALVTAAAFAALLVAGITVSTVQARRAERRFEQVRELANTFLFQFYDQVTPLAGSTAVRASIVETARKYLDGLAAEAGNDRGLVAELAQAYGRLGLVQGGHGSESLGQEEDARRSYRRSLELFDRLGVSAESPPDLRFALARTLLDWCELERGAAQLDAAERLAQRAMTLTAGDIGPSADLAKVRASAALNLGEIRFWQGHLSDALSLFESGVSGLRDFQARSGNAAAADKVFGLETQVLRTRARLGDLDGAAAGFEALLPTRAPCDVNHPAPVACRNLAIDSSWAADVYGAADRPHLGEYDKAAALYERSIAILESMAAADPRDRQVRFDLAGRYGKLADVIWQKDPKRSLELYERAMSTAAELSSPGQRQQIQVAYWNAVSRPLLSLGRTGEARQALDSALKAMAKPDDYDDELAVLDLQMLWGRLLAKEGKREESQTTLTTAIEHGEALRRGHPNDLRPIYYVSNLYRELASATTGEQRRNALGLSAAAWHSWPSTSYTRKEEQNDLAAAHR
jgi:hypothetical protein